jgi:hypothetical protein
MKQKNKKTLNVKQLFITVLVVFMFACGIAKTTAEEREGVVIANAPNPMFSNVLVYIDTTNNGAPDHLLIYADSFVQSPVGTFMNSLLQKGAKISFDDEKTMPFIGYPSVSTPALLSINDISVLTWFPNLPHEQWFPYAVKKAERERQQGSR